MITREYEARTEIEREREEEFSTRSRSVWSGHQRRNKKTLRTADVGARTTRKELQITRIVSESWLAAAREGILNKAAAALQLADLETHGRYRFWGKVEGSSKDAMQIIITLCEFLSISIPREFWNI